MDFTKSSEFLSTIYAFMITAGTRFISCLVILFVGAKIIKKFSQKIRNETRFDKLDPNLRGFLSNMISLVRWVAIAIACISILGIDTTSFITVLASAGVAIGLALQGALSNVAGGIMILLFKPFHVGDFVEAAGNLGTVTQITVFYTFIKTNDAKVIMVPNGSITGSSVTNYSVSGNRRVDIDFSADYSRDTETVKNLILKVAGNHPKTLKDPVPFARMTRQDDSACIYTLRVWCKNRDYWDVYFDMMEQVKAEFDANSISIPFPQMDVHIRK